MTRQRSNQPATTTMRSSARCPQCGSEVQIILVNPSPHTKFFGPEAANNRYRFAPHFYSRADQRRCPGSDTDVPAA